MVRPCYSLNKKKNGKNVGEKLKKLVKCWIKREEKKTKSWRNVGEIWGEKLEK